MNCSEERKRSRREGEREREERGREICVCSGGKEGISRRRRGRVGRKVWRKIK